MKIKTITIIASILFFSCSGGNKLKENMSVQIKSEKDSMVIINNNTSEEMIVNEEYANKASSPQSTFKIWNTLIGIECGEIVSSTDLFYKWDSVERYRPEWNRNMNLNEAFKTSCVPAYQNLARHIGKDNMNMWLNRINYGNKDTSMGIDVFWLEDENGRSIMISPLEQARLMEKLVNKKLPFGEKSMKILKEVMLSKQGKASAIYGKTGTGRDNTMGWYVGYIEGNDFSYSFACRIYGENISGKDAQAKVEAVFSSAGLFQPLR